MYIVLFIVHKTYCIWVTTQIQAVWWLSSRTVSGVSRTWTQSNKNTSKKSVGHLISTLCSKQIETAMQLCPGVSHPRKNERSSVAYVRTDGVMSERCTHALANPSLGRHCSSRLGLSVIQHICQTRICTCSICLCNSQVHMYIQSITQKHVHVNRLVQ